MSEINLKKKKDFQISYTQGWHDLTNDFLIPCLKLSKQFDYISGYFSAKLFIPIFNGMKDFLINNDGIIRLLVGFPFSEEIDIINMSDEELEEKFLLEFKDEFLNKDSIDQNLEEHMKLLAWLLYKKRIEIRWGVPIEGGILHEKIGIFYDGTNYVSFSGSSNLTYAGWLLNRESFKVYPSWKYDEFSAEDKNKFDMYWKGDDKLLKIFSFPQPFIKEIIEKHQVEKIDEIDFEKISEVAKNELQKSIVYKISKKLNEKSDWIYREGKIIPQIEIDKPREHQEEAIDYLRRNNYNGFLSMATGSGKTKTSIFSSYELYKQLKKKGRKLVIVIGVPDLYLVEQWSEKEVGNYSKNIVLCCGEKSKWIGPLTTAIRELKFTEKDHYFIIGTYKSLTADLLNNEIISTLPKNADIQFIGDEAHSLGSPTGLYFLENFNTKYKIGLSATPRRHFDEDGTIKLLEWFFENCMEGKAHEFDLKKAQEKGAIMKFEYKIFTCELEQKRFNDFIDISNDISKQSYKLKDLKKKSAKGLTILLNKRADLIKKSKNKIPIFKDIIRGLIQNDNKKNQFWKSVIYCKDGDQVDEVDDAILELNNQENFNIKIRIINGDMPIKKRTVFIDHLAKMNINTLIAMKCLDQGVDIPSLEKAIFLSSSGSDLEHIQRAGRILRKTEYKKNIPIIYDIIILPSEEQIKTNFKISSKIFDLERRRIEFFAEYAINKPDIETELYHISRKFR